MSKVVDSQDWCKAGGITNFAKMGLQASHPNYGSYHVTGYDYDLDVYYTNCIFCGKEITDNPIVSIEEGKC